jgi:hypothetical protein
MNAEELSELEDALFKDVKSAVAGLSVGGIDERTLRAQRLVSLTEALVNITRLRLTLLGRLK